MLPSILLSTPGIPLYGNLQRLDFNISWNPSIISPACFSGSSALSCMLHLNYLNVARLHLLAILLCRALLLFLECCSAGFFYISERSFRNYTALSTTGLATLFSSLLISSESIYFFLLSAIARFAHNVWLSDVWSNQKYVPSLQVFA